MVFWVVFDVVAAAAAAAAVVLDATVNEVGIVVAAAADFAIPSYSKHIDRKRPIDL